MIALRIANRIMSALVSGAYSLYSRVECRRDRLAAIERLTPGERVIISNGHGIDRVLEGYTARYSGSVGVMAKVVIDGANHYTIVDPRSLLPLDWRS